MTHVDLDQVADLDGGALDPEQERVVLGHLESCESCSQLLERVREVHTLLAAEPAPELPPAVAARLDDSLAAAARGREERTEVASLERAKSRRRTWAPRLLAAAVGLAVVGGGVYVAQDVLGSGATSEPAASRDAGGAAGRSQSEGTPSSSSSPPIAFVDEDFNSQLRKALTRRPHILNAIPDSVAVPTHQRAAATCVTNAFDGQAPGRWSSYRITFDSRPAVLVLSPAGQARVRAWVVECQPSPTVRTSTVIPAS
jgi:anti-sigma factor RsiW